MPITNNFEHGVVDATVTTANSGDAGLGNTAANLVQVTTGHTMTFDDDWAAHGSRSVKITTNSTVGTYLRFTPDAGDRQTFSVYGKLDAASTGGAFPIVTMTGASTAGGKWLIGTTGTVSLQNAAGTGLGASVSTATIPLDTVFRIDGECIKGTTTSNGTMSYRVFVGANVEGTTPDFSYTTGATVNTGTVQINQFYAGKGTSTGLSTAAAFHIDDVRSMAHATDWYAPLGADSVATPGTVVAVPMAATLRAPYTGAVGKVALIGDSQFDQFPEGVGTGEGRIRTLLQAHGFSDANIWWHGVGGKTLSTADSTGTTTIQDVANARAAIGEPDLWVINLGGNSSGVSETTFKNAMNAILDAIGNTHRVLWFGIQGNPNTTNRANADVWIRDTIQARPLGRYADVNSFLHNGRDETGLWQGDAIHLTDAGYAIRNPYVAEQTRSFSPSSTTNTPTITNGVVVTAPAMTAAMGAPTPAVTAAANVAPPASGLAVTARVPAVTAAANVAAVPSGLTLTARAPAATAGANVVGVKAALTLATPAPVINAGGSVTVAAVPMVTTLTAYAPTVSAGTVTVATVATTTLAARAPTVTAGGAAAVLATRMALGLSVGTPNVTDGSLPTTGPSLEVVVGMRPDRFVITMEAS